MADQGIYVMFPVIVVPVKGLLHVNIQVVPVSSSHTAPFTDCIAVFVVHITILHLVALVDGDTGLESEILKEFGLDITAHVQVVDYLFIPVIVQHVLQIRFCLKTGGPRLIPCTGGAQRRILLARTFDHDFIPLRIVHHITVLVTLINRRHRRITVHPIENVFDRRSRRTITVTCGGRLHITAAVSHIDTGF